MASLSSSPEVLRIEDVLSYPIMVAERVLAAVDEAESFKLEFSEIGKHVDRILQMLRLMVRIAAGPSSPPLYDRPIRRVAAEVSRNLERALNLSRRCGKNRSFFLRRVVRITGGADFRKVFNLLESSVEDLKWLVGIFDGDSSGGGGIVSLPPIVSNDPIISWVWSSIAAVQMSSSVSERVDAANQLASLAQDNDRNKKIIVEENGVSPLLNLLEDVSSPPEGKIAAAVALRHLANDRTRVRAIVADSSILAIVNILANSPARVQIEAARLVARMAENDSDAREDFARENAIRPLVTLLSFESNDSTIAVIPSIHSIVQINKEYQNSGNGNQRRERENEPPEIKEALKLACAEALWKLSRGSPGNSQKIAETIGLLCLANMVRSESGDLRFNCLMAIAEIAAAAESDADLRRSAFKTNSHAAKAVVEQLVRLASEDDDRTGTELRVPAIRSLGSLARTFTARESLKVISPLVRSLGGSVGVEAAAVLGKFVGPENFLRNEHSRAVVELGGVAPTLRLLRSGEPGAVLHGTVLLCCLALHSGGNSGVGLDQPRVLTALEGVERTVVSQHPRLKELVPKAVYHLNLYHQPPGHSQRFSFVP